MSEHLQPVIKNMPTQPGVYRYYDIDGNLLYIGKAKNLKNRVSSYFISKDLSYRIGLMVRKIHNIEYSVVATEKDALLLENALIKELQPRYNILLKDDKSYPYIKIMNEDFPRIFFTRKLEDDGAEYFGPFTSVHQVRSILELIKKLYPIRNCSLPLTEKNIARHKFKSCLEFHIGNCLAPCIANQSKSDYDKNVVQIRKIIKGNLTEVRHLLKEEMQQHAENLEFEKAEITKIKIQSLKEYISTSTVTNPNLGNLHVFGFLEENDKAFIHYMYVHEGTIVKTKNFVLKRNLDETKEDLLSFALLNTIDTEEKNDATILLPFHIFIEPALKLNIHVPRIGEKKSLLELAEKNATYYKLKGKENQKQDPAVRILEQMKLDLKLTELPIHIECFDNSNFQGTNAVSACVVFKNAKPSKKDYRHFNVKTVVGANDFDTMKEVVYRRYKRLLDENESLPQLIVIDGGKGQLHSAMESMKALNLEHKIQVVSIAKRLEEIYYPNDSIPMYINKKSETLKVLQHLRNEAHRFGITFHRNQRSKNTFKTSLNEIKGIGENLANKLLKEFGSIKKIEQTGLIELEKSIGKSKAKLVFDFYNNKKG
ncbi:MAG: excinuclease ABC subunit UvrC [Chitinophagales bacterium]